MITGTGVQERIVITWAERLDRQPLSWPGFPAGADEYDLTTVSCPCRTGGVLVNGHAIAGEVRLRHSAGMQSTAFLALAETWVGPRPRGSA